MGNPASDTFSLAGKRLPALDGMRGVAIAAIMCYHFVRQFPSPSPVADRILFELFSAGWTGVELFFVLSGFLLTAGLCRSRGSPAFFRAFYVRRALRICPLYYGLLAALIGVPLVLGRGPAGLQALSDHQAWFWLFLSNWFLVQQGGFGTVLGGYLWWLSLDQQFCLVWPVFVRWLTHRGLMVLSICLFLGSPVLRLLLLAAGFGPVSLYLITFSHLDGLALGCLLALWLQKVPLQQLPWRTIKLAGAACSVALAAVFLWRQQFAFWEVWASMTGPLLLSICSGCLLLVCLDAGSASWHHRFFTNPVLVSFGRYSYGLYLLHPLVGSSLGLVFDPTKCRVGNSMVPAILGFLAVASALSWLTALASWHLFEQRFLKLKDRISM